MSNNTSFTTPSTGSLAACVPSAPVSTDLQATMFSFLIILSFVGNSLIILIVAKNKRMHTVANALICNMSVADLLITLLPMVWEVVRLIHLPKGNWPMGGFMCTFVHMCIYLSVAASIFSLQMITCDRFFAIMFPLNRIITKKVLPYILALIWVAAFAFSSPTIYAMELAQFDGDTYCIEKWNPPFHVKNSPVHYTVILFVALYALPLLTMAVMYSAISWKLWKRIVPGESSSETEKQLLRQKKKVIKMLVVISLIFAICWLPVFVMQFVIFTSEYYQRCYTSFPSWFQFFAFFMEYLGSAINPYVYFIFSGAYRRGLKSVLTRFRRVDPKSTTTTRVFRKSTRVTGSNTTSTMAGANKTHDNIQMTEKSDGAIQEESAENLAKTDKNENETV